LGAKLRLGCLSEDFRPMSAAYAFLLASFVLERVFDPLIAIPSVVAGIASRRWLHVAAAAVIIATLVEAARYVSNFQPALLGVTWLSAAAWGSAAYAIRNRLAGPRKRLSEKAPSP
jgi:hypothetical protein